MDSKLANQRRFQGKLHPFCMVCSGSNPHGLALEFQVHDDKCLKATFHAHGALEGYEGLLHGGMIATLLDGIMTNCLFAHGVAAFTADLRLRYRAPVTIGPEICLYARINQAHHPLYLLSAELTQEGSIRAVASAKFMAKHE